MGPGVELRSSGETQSLCLEQEWEVGLLRRGFSGVESRSPPFTLDVHPALTPSACGLIPRLPVSPGGFQISEHTGREPWAVLSGGGADVSFLSAQATRTHATRTHARGAGSPPEAPQPAPSCAQHPRPGAPRTTMEVLESGEQSALQWDRKLSELSEPGDTEALMYPTVRTRRGREGGQGGGVLSSEEQLGTGHWDGHIWEEACPE